MAGVIGLRRSQLPNCAETESRIAQEKEMLHSGGETGGERGGMISPTKTSAQHPAMAGDREEKGMAGGKSLRTILMPFASPINRHSSLSRETTAFHRPVALPARLGRSALRAKGQAGSFPSRASPTQAHAVQITLDRPWPPGASSAAFDPTESAERPQTFGECWEEAKAKLMPSGVRNKRLGSGVQPEPRCENVTVLHSRFKGARGNVGYPDCGS
ncbi:hypothetical protein MPH_06267 [Macrophomina phaseolina MS6]|uniref:Uncharacterized protein n=1 Tax=Macrophomina phaseolina (strain MS6) TaxID=1126212 RepID=K2R2K6_MACPH|nr:hypothetical protein MPH_06267 [Macrophomina phaseolina MS6]